MQGGLRELSKRSHDIKRIEQVCSMSEYIISNDLVLLRLEWLSHYLLDWLYHYLFSIVCPSFIHLKKQGGEPDTKDLDSVTAIDAHNNLVPFSNGDNSALVAEN